MAIQKGAILSHQEQPEILLAREAPNLNYYELGMGLIVEPPPDYF